MKKYIFPILLILLAFCLSACSAGAEEVPVLEFDTADGGVSVLRLSFDGESPVFLENGAADDEANTMTLIPPYTHVFDFDELPADGVNSVYTLPDTYTAVRAQSKIEGILIYSEYAYAVVRDVDGQRLHPLSPDAPAMYWDEFYGTALKHTKESSELSGVENYGL